MDDLEKKDELEQKSVSEEIEEKETPVAEEEPVESEETMPEEPVAEVKPQEKDRGNLLGIVIGMAAFIAILVYCWMLPGGGSMKDTGVLYTKENDLYLYDLKNEPYLLQEEISAGGAYHYFYTAWGAEIAEEGNWVYYSANIDETGGFDLYRKDVKNVDAEAKLIDNHVYDYMVSKDGEVVAYLALDGDSLELCSYNGRGGWVVAESMHLENDVYSLSADGKYLVFRDAYGMLCAVETDAAYGPVKLTDESPLYALAETIGTLYFVAEAYDSYNIYSYDFDGEPALVAENVTYMELMPNGRDLLYSKVPEEVVPYSAIITDDMMEEDAALTEADGQAYEAKLKRDAIREAINNGEGIAPILQECYVLTGGKTVTVADNVISAIAVDHKSPFVTGYRVGEIEPVPISELNGELRAAEYYYYMNLAYGEQITFLADTNGRCEGLTGYGVQPESIVLSYDGSQAAYFAANPVTGGNILMQMEVGKGAEGVVIDMDVESMAFSGDGNWLSYYFDYTNGAGTLSMGDGPFMENACGVQYAHDEKTTYFIQNPDSVTGNGALQCWKGGEELLTIDENVFAFQYKGNGKVAYIKNYDVSAGVGDLYYFDGKEACLLDTDVTAIFIY